MQQQGNQRYVARFDVARCYESINHAVLLAILRQRGASAASEAVVADYLRLPDRHRSGRGMTAGGSLSPLLAAVMLIPLGVTSWISHFGSPMDLKWDRPPGMLFNNRI